MRKLYSFLVYLLTPLALLHLAFRGLRNPAYLKRWSERFAWFSNGPVPRGIVVHAASVGEVNAASGLLHVLQKRFPDLPLTVTTLTPSGSERVRSLFADRVFHVYLPLDLPGAVRRFFMRTRPRVLIIMETEIWPNFFFEAASRGIPLVIANARISERSINAYLKLRQFIGPALRSAASIGAQSRSDAKRLEAIGANPATLSVTGNLKYDVKLPAGLVEQAEPVRLAWGTDRLVWLAGSTHEKDEIAVVQAFNALLPSFPAALLVLVPRHPERFGRAAQLARNAGLNVAMRSDGVSCPREAQCFVVDSIGELMLFYAACDVAFVGGSLDRVGGHNVLEPAALGKPVIVGPHTFNFREIMEPLLAQDAAIEVRDQEELADAVRRLFSDPEMRDRMGQAGLQLVQSGQGALSRTLVLVEDVINRAVGRDHSSS